VFAEAFNFQEIDFSEALILENMREHRCAPNSRTYENILTLHCRHQRIDKALAFLEARHEASLPLNEVIATQLIYCHASRGELTEAEAILDILNRGGYSPTEKNVHDFAYTNRDRTL
jgi:hypothetical protein